MTHISEIHIRFGDIDAMGHVNNSIYLQYFEQARMLWFKEMIGSDWNWTTDGIVLAHCEIDYKQPLYLHDRAVIETSIEQQGRASFTVGYRIIKTEDDRELLVATGNTVLVCFDHQSQKAKSIPKEWRKRMSAT
ncbi:acyl-CoA thioesterase [Mariprofundus sp. NF]|uniref:acyl-CoA thioesterase n=1 Tax=Mariprofundus sp. NF TaxID=2608716 RepID=UPI0015A3603E|nr:thioesterase family protein [Mariprofundus sp. NF]NWF39192.1 acyl-CoA thioesterase [Mariprofundus sp. NF]